MAIVLDNSRDLPLHAQLRKALERLIEDRFDDESRFYSESQLINNLRVSQGTVRRALADLASRGILEKRQARCTIVRKPKGGSGLANLAVFVSDYSSHNAARFLSALHMGCLNRSVRMQPIYTHRGERLLKAYDNLNFAPNEGGVVLLENSARATFELGAALGDRGYNCVAIDTLSEGHHFKTVAISNHVVIIRGLEYLYGLGHRRISLIVNEPEEKVAVQQRIAAFENWVRDRTDLDARVVRSGMHLWDDPTSAGEHSVAEAMKGSPKPTAIFAISDVGALGAIKRLRQDGYRVPADVSVIGTDGLDVGAMVHPSLTTLVHPIKEMTEAVFELLSQPSAGPRELLFEPSILERESSGPPAA
jgi:LacI family transcriptional regulator